MTARIFFKLILGTLGVLIVALIAVDVLALRIAEQKFQEALGRELLDKARVTALLLGEGEGESSPSLLKAIAEQAGARVTLVATDGRVLADSEAAPSRMENHKTRVEIVAALGGGEGIDRRRSGTTGTEYLYVAVPWKGGALRLAMPLEAVAEKVNAIRVQMLVSTALAFLPAFVVAAFFARSVSSKLGDIIDYAAKLAEGNFHARLPNAGADELGLLGRKLNETGAKLEGIASELEREHQELEKVDRVRKDFVINVSHELRTPLASIQGYTETLLNGAIHDSANNVRFLEIIRQNAERLTNLASDLLTLSRIELKSQRFHFASYYVRSLLTDAVDSVRPMADRKQIRIMIEPGPEMAEVFCDSKAIHQALTNLLDNAIKYTPEAGEIRIGARAVPRKHGSAPEFIEMYVRDSGIGIPAEDLPRLFERFYRVDKARSRELGGTGLGLAIVKHLARAHGGDVAVTSEIGAGSEFTITVPVDDPGAAAEATLQDQFTVM